MFNDQSTMQGSSKPYDLEERTKQFAQAVITMAKTIPTTPITSRILEQLIGAAGSIGANYCEATEAESKRDFIHKIGICKKETKETHYWLTLLTHAYPQRTNEIQPLQKESHELLLIFSKSVLSARKNDH